MKVPITKPFFGPEELEAVQKPLATGWVVQGPYVKEFEDSFNDFTGSKFSVATSSCTTAALAPIDENRNREQNPSLPGRVSPVRPGAPR